MTAASVVLVVDRGPFGCGPPVAPFGEGDDDRLEVEPLLGQVVFPVARRRGRDGHQSLGDEQLEPGRQDVRGDPQTLLSALITRTAVLQFEITKPSLHDIFIRIARPTDDDLRAAGEVA